MTRNLPALGPFKHPDFITKARLTELEARLEALSAEPVAHRDAAAEKVRTGAVLTRAEAATFLGVSTKKIQRMDSAGAIVRCRGLGGVVRYSARDVLRLVSASAPKGA